MFRRSGVEVERQRVVAAHSGSRRLRPPARGKPGLLLLVSVDGPAARAGSGSEARRAPTRGRDRGGRVRPPGPAKGAPLTGLGGALRVLWKTRRVRPRDAGAPGGRAPH